MNKKSIAQHGGMKCPKIRNSSGVLSKIMKYYQFSVFYERELKLWNENSIYRGLPFQMYIYHNRMQYLKKLPKDIKDYELIRGINIAGIVRGYSVFDTTYFNQIIQDYGIKSIYDPCSGWGERMLCSYLNDVKYIGVDINNKLFDGYNNMIKDFDIKNCELRNSDNTYFVPNVDVDMTFVCPPYHDIEVYTDIGVENLDYDEYLNWWNEVVINSIACNSKYFGLQINQKYKSDLSQIVLYNGYRLIKEFQFDVKKSHLSQNKKEFESVLLFER